MNNFKMKILKIAQLRPNVQLLLKLLVSLVGKDFLDLKVL